MNKMAMRPPEKRGVTSSYFSYLFNVVGYCTQKDVSKIYMIRNYFTSPHNLGLSGHVCHKCDMQTF